MTVPIFRAYVGGAGRQIHYRRAGPTDSVGVKRPLVLFHQNPASSLEYEGLMRLMGRDRLVIALDMPGYGQSDPLQMPPDISGYAEELVRTLPDLGINEATGCDVYGFHTGALVAVEAALLRPGLIRHIALTGLPMREPQERAERLRQAQETPGFDEAGSHILATAKALWDYVVKARTPGVPLPHAARAWHDKLTALDHMHWAYLGVWSFEYENRLPLLSQPTLLLQPHEDIWRQSVAAARLIPNHRIVEMPDFNRDIFDLPDAVAGIADHLRDFFDLPVSRSL